MKKQKRRKFSPGHQCPRNEYNMNCNSCGGEICGQREVSQTEWFMNERAVRFGAGYARKVSQ